MDLAISLSFPFISSYIAANDIYYKSINIEGIPMRFTAKYRQIGQIKAKLLHGREIKTLLELKHY